MAPIRTAIRRVACERALYHRAITDVTVTMPGALIAQGKDSDNRRRKRSSSLYRTGRCDQKVSRIDSCPSDSIWIPAIATTLSNCIYARTDGFLTKLPKNIFMQIGGNFSGPQRIYAGGVGTVDAPVSR